MKTRKTALSLLLISSLCLWAMEPLSFAFQEKQAGEYIQTVMSAVKGESPLVSYEVTSESQQDTLDGIKTEGIHFDASAVVDYSYQLTYYEDNPELVGVDLEFSVIAEDETNTFNMSGDVSRIEAENDGIVLITGSIYKNFVIDGVSYNFAVGFRKLESSDEISIGLVITPLKGQYQNFYSFGSLAITEEIYDVFQNTEVAESSNSTSKLSAVTDCDEQYVEFIGESSGYLISSEPLKDSMTGLEGSSIEVFKYERETRFIVLVSSKCAQFTSDSLNNESNQLLGAYVNAFNVGLIKTNPEGRISGFDNTPTIASEYPDETTMLYGGSHCYIHVENLGSRAELNVDDMPIPVIFQVARGLDTGLFEGTVYADMTYLIETTAASFYVRTTRAECSVSMPL